MFKRLLSSFVLITGLILLAPAVALAHVIVTPNQAGIGSELVFNVSVPNERQSAVVEVKLLIPSGVGNVTPTSEPGWTITTSTNNNPKNPEVTSISWSGNIPLGQREDFSFGAQVPAQPTQLDWKAYQTYSDGTVVHWDQTPSGSDDSVGTAGPYSVTQVIDDLSTSSTSQTSNKTNTLALVLSIAALVIAIATLFIRKKK